MQIINALKWRYATKKYDPSKKIAEADINVVKESIQLAASSFGIQLYKVMDVRDDKTRAKLRAASYDQAAITDASHLFVFTTIKNNVEGQVENYIKHVEEIRNLPNGSLSEFEDGMKNKLTQLKKDGLYAHWTARQVYIPLANALATCGELKIDSTPIEGFVPGAYNEILGLQERGLQAVVVLALGYRASDDMFAGFKKVRKSQNDLFELL